MSKRFFIVFIVLEITCFIPNISYSGDLRKAKTLVLRACSLCHGLDGVGTTSGNSAITPNLTAQQYDYLIAKLKDYRSGKIKQPQMSLIAQKLTDEDIINVSEWYSKIKIEITLPK